MRILPSKMTFASGITELSRHSTDRWEIWEREVQIETWICKNLRKMKKHCMLSLRRVQCGRGGSTHKARGEVMESKAIGRQV